MSAIFLSASVPHDNRGTYHETADPDLIKTAVKDFVNLASRNYQIVCGCDPTLTHTIVNIFESSQIDPTSVTLYQSEFFEECYPEENLYFKNLIMTEAVPGNRNGSLLHMRREMLSRNDLVAAVFIGGMDAVETEYQIFRHFHPSAKILPILSPGGGSLNLALDHGYSTTEELGNTDFKRIFERFLAEI